MSAFATIFDPLGKDEFKQRYFNRVPLHLTRNQDQFSHLLSIAEFCSALKSCDRVRAIFSHGRQTRISHAESESMYLAGATICVRELEMDSKPLAKMASTLRTELGYCGAISVNGYLSPPNSGLVPHFDRKIVTAMQLIGEKTWKYCPIPIFDSPYATVDAAATTKEAINEHLQKFGTQEVTLVPGSVLCLPAGCIHSTEAKSQSLSLNVAFEYVGYSVADYCAEFIRRRLLSESSLRSPFFFSEPDAALMATLVEAGDLISTTGHALSNSPDAMLKTVLANDKLDMPT